MPVTALAASGTLAIVYLDRKRQRLAEPVDQRFSHAVRGCAVPQGGLHVLFEPLQSGRTILCTPRVLDGNDARLCALHARR